MILLGRKTLTEFAIAHAEVLKPLQAWVAEIEGASWRTPQQVRAKFATASIRPDNHVIFNLKGKKFRLEVQIAYQTGIVTVKRIGTHAEYNRW